MKLYGGIDLHSNNLVLVLMDESGKVWYRKRMANDLERLKGILEPNRGSIEGLVVESTYNWYWLVDGLQEAGFRVHLANPAAIVQYSGLKYTDDDSDARWLAELLRLNILQEGYIYPKAERAVRDLLRKRGQLVREKTRQVLSVQNLVARNLGVSLSANEVKRLKPEMVDERMSDKHLALAVKSSLSVIDCLEAQIQCLEEAAVARVKLCPEFRVLQTVSGIGKILALTIMLEAGDIRRFPKVGNFASYCRCVGSEKLSNGKRKGRGNTRNGNKYLSWAFIEAANFAIRYDARIKRYYQRKRARTHQIVALKTVAHKLARACYYLLRDQVPFNAEKAFM
ncbi:MAG: IS110 family transposase [Anaerolineales bacterium]